MGWRWSFVVLLLGGGAGVRADSGVELFESRVRPVLVEKCYSCHSAGAKKVKGGLLLDSREGVLKGGESGAAVVPGEPAKSRLVEAVSYTNVELAMPPKEKLSDKQIADLTEWVRLGAPWPPSGEKAGVAAGDGFALLKRKGEHWAWRPVGRPEVPKVEGPWGGHAVDAFVMAKLKEKGLSPAGEADRYALIRRLYFDLVGLPPSVEEVEAFVADGSGGALERVVDRLLASPQFGVRWGRHWLDLVRYAETLGHEFDYAIPHAWRYRDYVVRALNEDLRYDRFLMEHVAGDLMESPRRTSDGHNESMVGTGFWWLGEEVHSPVDVRAHQADRVENRIDVLGKAFLGMTVACARCHDHKFDAISAEDYYALYGYLKSTRYAQRAVNEDEIRAVAGKLRELKAEMGKSGKDEHRTLNIEHRTSNDVELARRGLEGWMIDGVAFERCGEGEFVVRDEGVVMVGSGVVAHSGLLSKSLEGAIRSPAFVIDRPYLHVRLAGKNARFNVVVDNFVLIKDPIYGGLKRAINSTEPEWVSVDVSMWKGHEAYFELLDHSVGDLAGPAGKAEGWAALERVVMSSEAKPPAMEELVEKRISADRELIRKYRELEKAIPAPVYVPAAVDGTGVDERVFIRGSPRNLGKVVPRRFLEAIDSHVSSEGMRGSGRLELARRIASLENPLTARVMVNRVWHHLFGRGIVASVDNFGVLGEAPSHPELLDYLARRFVDEGWSVKRLIRSIVLSRAYRMSSRAVDEHAEGVDPGNMFLHRQNVRRLSAEAIRDSMLAVSGRIDLTVGGPGVPVHITSFMEGRGRPAKSGPVDGDGRRSLYVEVRRNFLPPMMLAFDAPIPLSTMGRRSVSNVPGQALILMNDPFVAGEGRRWGERIVDVKGDRERVRRMYLGAFSRLPSEEEIGAVLEFMGRLEKEYGGDEVRVWGDVAHAMMNVKEFVFLN